MTVIEQIHNFWLKAKTLDQTGVEAVKSFDVVTLLNNAQDVLVDELVNNKAWAYLRPITTSFKFDASPASTPPFITSYLHGIEAGTNRIRVGDLAAIGVGVGYTPYHTYRNYVRSQSNLDRSAVPVLSAANVANEDITLDVIHEIETSGTNTPMFTNPKALIEGNNLVVIGDGYTTINEVTVTFVRNPALMDPTVTTAWSNGVRATTTTCELPSELHQRVVDIAINIFYSQVNAQAVQNAKQKQAAK